MKKLGFAAIAIAVSVISLDASAVQQHYYHGVGCTGNTIIGYNQSADYNQWGAMNTSDSTLLYLICPLPLTTGNYYTNITAVTVYGYNRGYTYSDYKCSLRRNYQGTEAVINEQVGSGADFQTITFGNLPQSLAYQAQWAVFCTLPAHNASGYSHLTSVVVTTDD